jgi:hypothetical protein
MLLLLLLDPHWEVVGDAIYFLFMLGIGVAVLGWLALRVEARAESKRTDTTSRGWSTKKATIAVLAFFLFIFFVSLFS